ncbi:hypothetical protein A2U01_0066626, partial [Trifolium medium]|nr:hypothetical protein [Trifolium medium]
KTKQGICMAAHRRLAQGQPRRVQHPAKHNHKFPNIAPGVKRDALKV